MGRVYASAREWRDLHQLQGESSAGFVRQRSVSHSEPREGGPCVAQNTNRARRCVRSRALAWKFLEGALELDPEPDLPSEPVVIQLRFGPDDPDRR
jgi:hypothetical protein